MNSVDRIALSVLCAMTLLSTPAWPQIDLAAGGGVGFVVASGDYSGTTADYYNGTKYGFTNGYALFGKGRAGILGLTVVLEAGYTSFKAHGDTEPGQGSLSISQHIISFRVGPEYQLVSIPLAPIKPYVGVYGMLNTFKGDATFNGASRVPSGTMTMPSASRLGLGAELGTIISVSPVWMLDFTISYNFMNLSGSEWTAGDPAHPRRADSYTALNDAADPLFLNGDQVHFIETNRSIQTLMFTASILFGL